MSDSFRTFHSTTPNPNFNSLAAPKITSMSSMAQPFCICTHCNHLLTFNPHAAGQGITSNTGFNVQSQHSSRWSPTPVQLLVLEELYRHGTKTPSAEQIQQIASQLRQFGKIEGKNVFYWFQNHKARERQKRRRLEMEKVASSTEELKGTGCEVKETEKWASTSNCSEHAEESAALDISENGSIGWTQFEERRIQVLRKNIEEKQATTYVAAHRTPNTSIPQNYDLPVVFNRENFNYYDEENAVPRTLELFPLSRDDLDGISHTDQRKSRFYANATMDTEINSSQFFEFLPLRN